MEAALAGGAVGSVEEAVGSVEEAVGSVEPAEHKKHQVELGQG